MTSLENVPVGTGFPDPAQVGQLVFRTDEGKFYLYDGTNWLLVGLLDSSNNLKISGRYLGAS